MPDPQDRMHIIVAGCGPSGLFAATACASRGLSVAVVAPSPEAPWPNQYGVWVDEFEPLGLADTLGATWPTAEVWLGPGRRLDFQRPYGAVDNAALAARLRQRCLDGGGRFIQGRVAGLTHRADGVEVVLEDGQRLRAEVFIDATGRGAWIEREGSGPTAFQTAYGVVASVEGDLPDPTRMIWMDMRPPAPELDQPPTFLYAMPMPDGRLFLEETSLVHRPGLPFDQLRARLERRLAGMNLRIVEIHHTELCRIPMDTPMPAPGQPVVGFGAAAAMIHPATGYMIAYAARKAEALAEALADARDQGARAMTEAAWSAIWDAQALQAEALYRFGADVLTELDGAALRGFFQAFFAVADEPWRQYLARDLSPAALARVMWRVYHGCDPSMRARLRRASLLQPGRILDGLLGPEKMRWLRGSRASRRRWTTPRVQETT